MAVETDNNIANNTIGDNDKLQIWYQKTAKKFAVPTAVDVEKIV